MRKYIEGEYIDSLDELNRQEFIYANGKLTHRGWFQSWPIRLAHRYIVDGSLRYAVPILFWSVPEKDFYEMLEGDNIC